MEDSKEVKKKRWYEKSFFQKLVHSKLYLISFLITVGFFGYILNSGLKDSEGVISKRNRFLELLNKVDNSNDGYYKHEYKLDEEVIIDSCIIDSYSFIYKVEGSLFTKYFYNKCVGSIKMGEELDIDIKNDSFVVNKDVYNKIDDIDFVDANSNIEFKGNNIIILEDNDLILINKSSVFKNSSYYPDNTVNNIKKRYYKISDNKYKFILFYKDDVNDNNSSLIDIDDVVYSIFEIVYDDSEDKFMDPVMIVERHGNELLIKYNEDIKGLSK